jgi:hypothetical protein
MGLRTPSFSGESSKIESVAMLSNSIKRVVDWLQKLPFSTYQILDMTLTTTKIKIPHSLKRTPKGFLVLDRDANAVVYQVRGADDGPNAQYISLISSATVTVKIMLF